MVGLMNPTEPGQLSKREQQVMEIVYRDGHLTAQEIRERMPAAPSDSAVRALLSVLEEKGFLTHERDGRRYVYQPTVATSRAKRGALQRLLDTFYENSPAKLVASLLDPEDIRLPRSEIERIRALLDEIPHGKTREKKR